MSTTSNDNTNNGLSWDPNTIQVNKEGYVQIGDCRVWYRVWGSGDIPAVFLHGGPGQAVCEYGDSNMNILDPTRFTVAEIDQLGTGNSTPSVRDGLDVARKHYVSTTPKDIAACIAAVADELKWSKVYLHGGSWGSTLALLFAHYYPKRVLGMLMRGIFIGSPEELDATFDVKYAVASANVRESASRFLQYARETLGFPESTLGSSRNLSRFYLDKMLSEDAEVADKAAWAWWVHELYAMDEKDYSFDHLDPSQLGQARAVGFWEASMLYQLAFSEPRLDLLSNISQLPTSVPIAIVHGKHDLLCPMEFAKDLETKLRASGFEVEAEYVEAGHKISNPPVLEAVRRAANRFAKRMYEAKEKN